MQRENKKEKSVHCFWLRKMLYSRNGSIPEIHRLNLAAIKILGKTILVLKSSFQLVFKYLSIVKTTALRAKMENKTKKGQWTK